MMARRDKPEEIVAQLGEVGLVLSQGESVGLAASM